jgi:uncharacterized protein YbaR (Trm112 family)
MVVQYQESLAWLEDLLVCPLTHQPLQLVELDSGKVLKGISSDYVYDVAAGIPRMIPDPVPSAFRDKWDQWQNLQDNGALGYALAPELNLSMDDAGEAIGSPPPCRLFFESISSQPKILERFAGGCGLGILGDIRRAR